MEWSEIISIISLMAGLTAVLGLVYNLGKMNAKIEILWEMFKADARANNRKRGTVEAQSEYRLTEQGLNMIPSELKEEIKSTIVHKKRSIKSFLPIKKNAHNPHDLKTWDIVEKLGGVSRLIGEADKANIPVSEFVVLVEVYIQKHLED